MANEAETTTTTADGVPDATGGQPSAGQGIASAPQSVSGDAAKPKVSGSWTDDPEFRKQQGKTDRTIADLKAAADQARLHAQNALAEAAALKQQREIDRIQALDPEEKVKALEQMLMTREREQQQRQADATAIQARVNSASTKASERLAKVNEQRRGMGLDVLAMDDARLTYEGNTPEEKLASFFASMAEVTSEDAAAALAKARKEGQRSVVQALEDAGVPKTSGATSTPTSSTETEIAALKARWKKLKGTGNTSAFWKLQRRADELGISLE